MSESVQHLRRHLTARLDTRLPPSMHWAGSKGRTFKVGIAAWSTTPGSVLGCSSPGAAASLLLLTCLEAIMRGIHICRQHHGHCSEPTRELQHAAGTICGLPPAECTSAGGARGSKRLVWEQCHAASTLPAGTLASTAHTGAELPPAGLLHDTVEDTQDHSTPASFEQIELTFGKAVRRIVEGETRFSKISKVGCCHALPGDLWGLLLQPHCARVSVEIKVSTGCLTSWPAVVGAHASFHCTSDCRGNLQLLQDQRDGLCWLVRGSAVCGSSAKMCLCFRWHAAMVLEAHHLCASSFACMQYWRRLQGGRMLSVCAAMEGLGKVHVSRQLRQ